MLKLRHDTVVKDSEGSFITQKKQQLIGILGRRGEGKSYLLETIGEQFYNAGFTVLDLWGASNLENAFWCIARDEHKKAYPITLLAPDSLITPTDQIEAFNSKHQTRVPLVKIVKLPIPTKKTETDVNQKIAEILSDAIIDCRDNRRILVFNPKMYPREPDMFRSLEILLRELENVSYKHFHKLNPEDVGKSTRDEMTNHQKSYHKIVFLIREFGEVAPSKLKGDKSGESTLIKKALLKFVRISRHAWVSGVIDYQNASDAESSIRNQIDVWCVKKWTRRLGGDEFKWIFDHINYKRETILSKFYYSKQGRTVADSSYPDITELGKKWFYVTYANDKMRLWKVPELSIRHKEPHDSWEKITGIELIHDMKLVETTSPNSSVRATVADEKAIFYTISKMREKKQSWDDIHLKLTEMQKLQEISWSKDISTVKPFSLQKLFTRMKEKYENSD